MTARIANFRNRRYNGYVPAADYAADVINDGPHQVRFGQPALSVANNILNAQSIAVLGDTVAAGVPLLSDTSDVPFGRTVRIAASAAATSAVTLYGRDYLGQPLVESLQLNGAASVNGNKAFRWIDKIAWAATPAVTITVGWGTRLGLPYVTSQVIAEIVDGQAGTIGTLTPGSRVDPQTPVTIDPRGVYLPTVVLDGIKRLHVVIIHDNFKNAANRGGLYGIAHAVS